ncbi:UDP-Glycosyltransferase/glycogen phosphorylase [Cubamyces lactineus]|nr:UDP-Glycosyltransferase/glycogen phosphorylase [Cubamyces lactineus]
MCPVHMWGHARALGVLAARFVQMSPVTVTFCIGSKNYDKMKAEIASDFVTGQDEPMTRIRLLRMEQGHDPLDPTVYNNSVLQSWEKLRLAQPVECETAAGTPYRLNLQAEPLSAIIVDNLAITIANVLFRQRQDGDVPANLRIYGWSPVTTSYILSTYREDLIPRVEEMVAREGVTFNEAALKLFAEPTGRVVHSPALPPMYDYELEPQGLVLIVPTGPEMCGNIFIRLARFLTQVDGLLTFDASAYNHKATKAMRDWFGETGRKVYYAGPLIPSATRPISRTSQAHGEGDEGRTVMAFLDKQLAARGEKSVIYISFGSMFWPMDPAKLLAALEVLMQKNIPFLMTRPSPFAHIPDEFMNKLATYPGAHVANWVPQLAVLEHHATGWCFSHGGHNTVLECIHTGIPMILWPIAADQEPNAAHLTDQLDVAYELLEVRHGAGFGPIYRTGRKLVGTVDAVRDELEDVLVRAFGADGEAKRQRLLGVRAELEQAWAEAGAEGAEGVRRMMDRHPKSIPSDYYQSDMGDPLGSQS